MNSVKRLYQQFHPKNYKIKISPDTRTETFSGKVVISGYKVGATSNRLTFHQLGLKITNAKVVSRSKTGDKTLYIKRLNYQQKFDEIRIHFDSKIRSGEYEIELEFIGKITKQLAGMYISQHTIKTATKKIVTTQFESHHAREVFPCIDEPEAKATFDLSIVHDPADAVVSNTPISKQIKLSKSETETSFDTTPIMSTYLLAFVIGELEYKESKTKNGTIVRSYATADKIDYVDFSLEVAVKCIDFYNQYFDIPYPLDKCDLLALPDFSAGAMENWGCVTFREQAMLIDHERSSLANKQMVAMVVAHELAHQWFGNLVTMKWWTDLWLNEGFASWMEYFAINNLYPDWNLWVQFAVDEQQIALNLDSLSDTHPVEVVVKHPDEIRTIFDSISYSKGASIIHMLHEFVGPDKFRLGLQNYLKKYSYKNSTTNDLWESIGIASNKPVSEFMSAWTTQKGYPVIDCRVDDANLSISQKRFSFDSTSDDKGTTWPIALISNNENLPEIFNQKQKKFKGKFQNLKLNNGQTGFYRVIYDSHNLNILGKKVDKQELGDTDRLGLLSDLVETSKAGINDITNVLEFMKYYKNETSYVVWDIIASTIGSMKAVICDELLREKIKPFTKDLIMNEYKRLGINEEENENHFDTLLRPIILGLASSSDYKPILDYCQEQFVLLVSDTNANPVNPNFKSVILNTVARLGGETEYDQMIDMHNKSNLSEERTTLIVAITSFSDPKLIDRTLRFIKSENVRSQDISYWVAYSLGNRFAKEKTWEWIKTNWEWLEDKLGTDLSFFRMPIYVARSFNDIKYVSEYKEFFEPMLSPSFERSYKQGLEIINVNSSWKQKSFDKLDKFLNQYNLSK